MKLHPMKNLSVRFDEAAGNPFFRHLEAEPKVFI